MLIDTWIKTYNCLKDTVKPVPGDVREAGAAWEDEGRAGEEGEPGREGEGRPEREGQECREGEDGTGTEGQGQSGFP